MLIFSYFFQDRILYLIGVRGSKNTNTVKSHASIRLDYACFHIVITTPHSIVNTHNWEDRCISLRNQQTCTFDNHNEIEGGLFFHLVFCQCIIVDVLMQQQSGNLNPIIRRKTHQLTPAYVYAQRFSVS